MISLTSTALRLGYLAIAVVDSVVRRAGYPLAAAEEGFFCDAETELQLVMFLFVWFFSSDFVGLLESGTFL